MQLPFLDLTTFQVLTGFAFIAGLIALSYGFGLKLEKSFVVASIRVFVQLTVLGYVLRYVFQLESPPAMLVLLECMIIIASIEAARRQEEKNAKLVLSLLISLNIAVSVVLTFLFTAVFRSDPFKLPHYFIPLAGMVIGNAANGSALAVHRMAGDIRAHRERIEAALALGASPHRAIQPYLQTTIRTALIPTINTMMLTGLVQIPGIMGGLLMAGQSPVAAGRYQTIIMYIIPLVVMTSCLMTSLLVSRGYFSEREQLLTV